MNTRNFIYLSLVLPLLACNKPKAPPRVSPPPTAGQGEAIPSKPGTETPPVGGGGTEMPDNTAPLEPEGTVVNYPEPDPEMGESLQEGEMQAANEIRDVIEKQIRAKYDGETKGRALRDAHPKMHGCLRAEFEVDPAIPDQFAHGVLKKGGKFDAVIRYSNSSHIPTQADITKDGRGMAMKLFNVSGKKLLEVESQAMTQDFVLISHPVFFTKDAIAYIDFIKNFENSGLVALGKTAIALGVSGLKIANAIKSLQVASPIHTQYFSNVPYQLGTGAAKKAVKYTIKSCGTDKDNKVIPGSTAYINGPTDIPTKTKDDNYLRTRLIDQFKTSDACLEMFVQYRENPSMSVEDSMIEWTTAWHKVATITIKKDEQDIVNSPDLSIPQNKACDTLSFNPWHSLPEHKPLGSMNRVRKIVYEHISKLRHELNNEPRKEPAEFKTK